MKHTLVPTLYLTLLCATSANLLAGQKVTICHIPPGNPGNAHTITVSENAVDAHLAHGDTLGECDTSSSLSPVSTDSVVSSPGTSYVICDDRNGEIGRLVNISPLGRILTERIECK
jgi:hypothetical protein